MDHIIVKGLYLLKSDNTLLKIKLENSLESNLLMVFEGCFLENAAWLRTLKQYITIPSYDLDDDTQNEFFTPEQQTPYFWEIKTNLLNWNFSEINSSNFEDIKDLPITSWVLHIEWYEWNTPKNIFLFQSFHKANMYIAKSYWDSKLSITFTNQSGIFKNLNEQKILNLRKNMDVIALDDWRVYSFNRKRYEHIFNFSLTLKKHVWNIFTTNFLGNTTLFDFDPSHIPHLVLAIQENYRIAKKIFIIHKKQILDWFNMSVFQQHLTTQGIFWLVDADSWKIIIEQSKLEILLDALNHNYYTSWNGDRFKAKAKTKI